MKIGSLSLFCALIATVGTMTHALAQQQQEATRSITNITGDLYRAQDNAHYTVFLTTPEGIILADPINREFATWLKAELDERFSASVKYVLYSHYHGDHASGGDVFAETAEFISHENMLTNLQREAGAEALRDVRPPDTTYSDRTTITLGGKTVELIHSVPSHSDDMSILLFPEERTAFAVDFVSARRLPFRTMEGASPREWIAATQQLQTLDYDILALGHGDMGAKTDADDYSSYLTSLLAAVSEGIAEGKSVEELQQSIMLEDYKDWGQYDAWRAENILGTYTSLTEGQ